LGYSLRILLGKDMASNKTLNTFLYFTEYAFKVKALPFKVHRSPENYLEIQTSRAHVVATAVSVPTILIILVLITTGNEGIIYEIDKFNAEDLVLQACIVVTFTSVVGTHIWMTVNMEVFVPAVNLFLGFNTYLGKSKMDAYR